MARPLWKGTLGFGLVYRKVAKADVNVNRPHLAAVEAIKDALVLSTMRFQKYTDEYRANLPEIIEWKRKHHKPDLKRQEPEADAKVVDLMERLRRSLGAVAGAKRNVRRGPHRRAA